MRFIHVSDVHLGSHPEKEHPWGKNRQEEIWRTFKGVTDACSEMNIGLLLISGDLFDRPPSWADLERAAELFRAIPQTQVVIIAGPADRICEGAPWREFSWPENVHILWGKTPQTLHLDAIDTAVTGMSYYTEEDSSPYPERFPSGDEGEFRILMAYSGDERHTPCNIEALSREGFDYIALGGRRKAKLMPEYQAGYPGSPEPLDRRETGEHGFILGEISENATKLVFVPFSLREYVSLKVRITAQTTALELESSLRKVIAAGKKTELYSIRIEGKHRPGDRPDKKSLYQLGRVAWVQDDSVPDYNLLRIMDDHREDLIGMYLNEFMREKPDRIKQKAMYCGLEALLEGSGALRKQE